MAKSANGIRWGAYNRRRKTCDWYREACRLKRIETRRCKLAAGSSAVVAEHEALIPEVFSAKPAHTFRAVIEIDGCKRIFRAAFIPGFGWQGHSANLIVNAIRIVRKMAAA